MRITLLQTDLVWEDKQANLRLLHDQLQTLRGTTEIVVLPEMFSTGFSMDTSRLAEPMNGPTLSLLREWASTYSVALCGSFMVEEEGNYYNRAFFITPENEVYQYDKRHLFRMGAESEHFSPGSHRTIVSYRGWNICLQVCYDLRFPVWSRNIHNTYDLLIYVANWPASRSLVWNILLCARAIENQCYVCGVNRIGTDHSGLVHHGESKLYSPLGKPLLELPTNEPSVATCEISLDSLHSFRQKFPAWKDADPFRLE